jgi:uncharacterized membrane protein YvbJ
MGILAGTILYPSISESKKKKFSLWAVRIAMLVLIIVAFALTTKNFCKSTSYLSKAAVDTADWLTE